MTLFDSFCGAEEEADAAAFKWLAQQKQTMQYFNLPACCPACTNSIVLRFGKRGVVLPPVLNSWIAPLIAFPRQMFRSDGSN